MLAIGKQIRNTRQNKNLSQRDLANKIGYLSQSQISKIESGYRKTTVQDLIEIANALGVPVDELLTTKKGADV